MFNRLVDRMLDKKLARKKLARQRRDDQAREFWSSRLPSPGNKYASCISQRGNLPATQEDSSFFGKLPLDLRIMVYERLYDDLSISLHFVDDNDAPTFQVKGDHEHWLFFFPKTCRLAYLECTGLIYKSITFSCSEVACMQIFPSFIAPGWLQTIRNLILHLSVKTLYNMAWPPKLPPQNEETWEAAWEGIASMQGLKALVVHLTSDGTTIFEEAETRLAQPLRRISVEFYLVSIDWFPDSLHWRFYSGAFSDSPSAPWTLELRRSAG